MFGDINQCDPVEGNSQVHYNKFTSKTIKEMCPERVELKYILEGCSRYDTKIRNMLADFLKTGKVQPQFAAIGKYFKNICYLNETRNTVTEIYCNGFVKNKTHYKVNFKYNGKMEQYKVAIGMPILVRRNMKQENLLNMREFPIDEIENHDTSFKVNDMV